MLQRLRNFVLVIALVAANGFLFSMPLAAGDPDGECVYYTSTEHCHCETSIVYQNCHFDSDCDQFPICA